MQKYVGKLEPVEVPTEQARSSRTPLFCGCWAQIHWPVSHWLPLLVHAVSKTARKPEDERTVADVKDLNKLVVKVKASHSIPVCFGQ